MQGIHPGQPLQLVYEGQFLRGVRHGQGTAYFHSRGEVYSGQWVDGRRTGRGRCHANACNKTVVHFDKVSVMRLALMMPAHKQRAAGMKTVLGQHLKVSFNDSSDGM